VQFPSPGGRGVGVGDSVKLRIGNGFDVHAFVPGRPLVIGGVTIPFDRGLEGHSDADVLLHAIADAALGALALGDLGTHFPDTDTRWKGADSRLLLRHVISLVRQRGYVVANVDSTVVAQVPRLAPFIGQMRSLIATELACAIEQISIKATTTEHLGFTGREEGIAAMASVLLIEPEVRQA
jgi:2-C-methyl-D-erythritol 2,4-cyclodiphosphate synthase